MRSSRRTRAKSSWRNCLLIAYRSKLPRRNLWRRRPSMKHFLELNIGRGWFLKEYLGILKFMVQAVGNLRMNHVAKFVIKCVTAWLCGIIKSNLIMKNGSNSISNLWTSRWPITMATPMITQFWSSIKKSTRWYSSGSSWIALTDNKMQLAISSDLATAWLKIE